MTRIKGHAAILLAVFTILYTAVSSMAHANGDPVKIVVFGDSLSAGYDLPPGTSFPERLQKSLNDAGLDVEISSAGVSGDTTSGGLARLDWSVPDGTDAVLLELGANDALRGLPVEIAAENLSKMIERLKQRSIAIWLAGMRAPPNMGEDYQKAFDGMYPQLAEKYDVPLYPFFLDGVAAQPSLTLDDGMHPNEKGIDVIVQRILPFVTKLVKGLPRG